MIFVVIVASFALIREFSSRYFLIQKDAAIATVGNDVITKNNNTSSSSNRSQPTPASLHNLTAEGNAQHTHITTIAVTKNSSLPKLADDETRGKKGKRVLDLPADFRICRLNDALPVMGQDSAPQVRFQQVLEYQCTGQPYDDFLQLKQFPYVLEKHASNPKLHWGKRQSILPPSNSRENTNKNLLVVGNSHTRQFFASLQCQYADQLEGMQVLGPFNVFRYTFRQGQAQTAGGKDMGVPSVNFDVITNHPMVYSRKWKNNIEKTTGVPLRKYNGIIIGVINGYDPKYADKAKLWIDGRKFAEQNPEMEIEFLKYPQGIFLDDIAKYYQRGPIIWVSMFAAYKVKTHNRAVQLIKDLQEADAASSSSRSGKTRYIRAIDARQHIDEMGGEECSSNSRAIVATCITDKTSQEYSNGHRCAGDKGGQPDLLVWDVIEALWDAFGSVSSAV